MPPSAASRRQASTLATSTRALIELVLRFLRSVQAGKGSRGRKCPLHPTLTPEWITEKNFFFRLLGIATTFSGTSRSIRSSLSPTFAATRCCGYSSRARGHLRQPRGSALGHAAVRTRQRGLRLVRCAHQLRGRRGLRHRRNKVREMVAGRSPHRGKGHHPIPHGVLASHADERGVAASAAGVRAWMGELRWSAHEQVAGHQRRPGGGCAQVRAGPAAPLPDEGDLIRLRRRLHLGALRGATAWTLPTTWATWSAARLR